MKCLSIWQPHASLLVVPGRTRGTVYKKFETRSWPCPREIVGTRVGIHAGRNTKHLMMLRHQQYSSVRHFLEALEDCGLKINALPRGAIVGTAVVIACHEAERIENPGAFGDFGPGRFAFELADAYPLVAPVPWRGQQGFFCVPDDTIKFIGGAP